MLVVGYVDSNYASDLAKHRSTIGYMFTFGGGHVNWKSTLQPKMAMSTIKTKYMEIIEVVKNLNGYKCLLKNLKLHKTI